MPLTRNLCRAGLAMLVAAGMAAPAAAQMMDRPYDFAPRDRAGLAALMQQVENPASGPDSTSTTTIESKTYLCGDGGTGGTGASSKANSNCVVLDNATGQVNVGQTSDGDQDADSNSSSTENTISGAMEELQ